MVQDKSRIWSIERRHFQWPLTTPNLILKVTPFFDTEYLRNGKDTAIFTMEGEYETVPKLSNGTTFNDLEWPLIHISRSR